MKQAEDLFTQELPELGDSLTGTPVAKPLVDVTTQGAVAPAPSKYRFRFFLGLTDGTEIEWTGLTAKRAKDMYAYTSQSQPSNVTAFGWEECK
jgi:hypothetical protein